MKIINFYLYYDEELVLSLLAQLGLSEINVEFFEIAVENREDTDYKICVDPCTECKNIKSSFHLSERWGNGRRMEKIYANIEDIKQIKRNEFLYKAMNKVKEKIEKASNIFYHEGKYNEDLDMLTDTAWFKIKKEELSKYNCERCVIIAHKIGKNCIKPICIYLKC
ncbi:MAG: hypothetical protein RR922_00350 [Clostridia bacterium]